MLQAVQEEGPKEVWAISAQRQVLIECKCEAHSDLGSKFQSH